MTLPRALLIFAKSPKPGTVKTRLLPAVSPQQAAALHAACIADTLRMALALRDCDVLLFAAGGSSYFKKLVRSKQSGRCSHIFPQRGTDLGARLEHAFRKCFRMGYRELVVIGTDTPWMGAARLRQAFATLCAAEVVVGPAEDGGYYLLGSRKVRPSLFRKIPWGTNRVLQSTLRAISREKLHVKLLRKDFDLDRPKDLRRAALMLQCNPRLAPTLAAAMEKAFPKRSDYHTL